MVPGFAAVGQMKFTEKTITFCGNALQKIRKIYDRILRKTKKGLVEIFAQMNRFDQ